MTDFLQLAGILLASDSLLAVVLKHVWKQQEKKSAVKRDIAEIKAAIDSQADMDAKIVQQIGDLQRFNLKLAQDNSAMNETLRLLSYDMLAHKLYVHIERGYATHTEREAVNLYIRNYKANHWNGDMDEMLKKFNELPYVKN